MQTTVDLNIKRIHLFSLPKCAFRFLVHSGRPGVHELRVLGADRVLRPDRAGRHAVHRCGQIEDSARVLLSAELVRRSVSVRDSDGAVSARFVRAARPVRPVQGQGAAHVRQQQLDADVEPHQSDGGDAPFVVDGPQRSVAQGEPGFRVDDNIVETFYLIKIT